MSHANALLSPKGRLLLARRVVVHGWNLPINRVHKFSGSYI